MATLSEKTELETLTFEVAESISRQTVGPDDPTHFAEIQLRLGVAQAALPPLYRDAFSEPLGDTFERIGPAGWADVLARDPQRSGIALLGLDLVQAVTQRGEGYLPDATAALQEVVSDLYDGFLSAADRHDVAPPDHGVAPPLVKWGRPVSGPYAWTAPAARSYGCLAGVINMPPAFAAGGLAAWSAVGHETAGHHILHADDGLREALANAVRTKIMASKDADLKDKKLREHLAAYWADRIDESASDVLGVVNMGPAAAVGLIAYFRGLAAVARGEPRLSHVGPGAAVHPAPLARAMLMAEALACCSFSGAKAWRNEIDAELTRDVPSDGRLLLAGEPIDAAAARASARNAALAILKDRVAPLENKALSDIQDWRQRDQNIVEALTLSAILDGRLPNEAAYSGVYAAHGVAAGVMGALLTGRPSTAQARMIAMVSAMHRSNPSWSQLAVSHSGDLDALHVSGMSRDHALAASGGEPADRRPAAAGSRRSGYESRGGGGGPVPLDGGSGPVLADGGPGAVLLDRGDGLTRGRDGGWRGGFPMVMSDGEGGPILLTDSNWPEAGRSVVRRALGASGLSAWRLRRLGLSVTGEGSRQKFAREPGSDERLGGRVDDEGLRLILGAPD